MTAALALALAIAAGIACYQLVSASAGAPGGSNAGNVASGTPGGRILFQSYISAGASRRWTFRHAVDVQLRSPGGVKLIVNGASPLPPGLSHPVTVRLGPSRSAR